MKILLSFFSTIGLVFLTGSAFAHEAEIPHEEPVPTISPLLLVGIAAVFAVGGFVLWKFVLHNNKSTPDQLKAKSQEQTINTQTRSVPEAKKDVNNTPS